MAQQHITTVQLQNQQFMRSLAQMTAGVTRLTQHMDQGFNRTVAKLDQVTNRAAGSITRVGNSARVAGGHFVGMAQHTAKVEKGLLKVSSAAAGVLIGTSILQRNIMGLALSFLFIRWSMLGVAAAAAAVTVALGSAVGLVAGFVKLHASAFKAGVEMEATGQRMASFLRSGERAQAIIAQADEVARSFGAPRDEVEGMLFQLERFGLRSDAYIKALLNTAAATGTKFDEMGTRFTQLLMADSSQRESLMKQFAKDFDLPVKNYANTLELAAAMNERFYGSIEAFSQTTRASINKMKAAWQSFMMVVGALTMTVLKPIIDMFAAFFGGLAKGFNQAKEADKATGELARRQEELKVAVEKLLPLLIQLGVILGRILYRASVLAAKGIKILIDAIRSALKWAKEFKDDFIAAGKAFKEHFLDSFTGLTPTLAGLIAGLSSIGDDIIRALGPIFSRLKPKIGTLWDDLWRGLKVGTVGLSGGDDLFKGFAGLWDNFLFRAKYYAKFPSDFLDDAGKGLGKLLRGGFSISDDVVRAGLNLGDDIIRGLGRGIRAALRSPAAIFRGAFAALKQGLIFALGESLALTVTDYLPISTGLKTSIEGMIRFAFLGAAVGSLFGPFGTLIGAGVGLAIAAGLEYVAPGTAKTVMDWLDRVFLAGMKNLGTFIQQNMLPALSEFGNWVKNDGEPAVRSWARATADDLQPKLEKLANWIRGDGKSAITEFGSSIKTTALSAITQWWQMIDQDLQPTLQRWVDFWNDKLEPALADMVNWINQHIMPAVRGLTIFIFGTLIPALVQMHMWFAEKLAPIIGAVAGLITTKFLVALTALQLFIEFILFPVIKGIIEMFGKWWEAGERLWQLIDGPTKRVFEWMSDFCTNILFPAIDKVINLGVKALVTALEVLAVMENPFKWIPPVAKGVEDALWWIWRRAVDVYDSFMSFVGMVNPWETLKMLAKGMEDAIWWIWNRLVDLGASLASFVGMANPFETLLGHAKRMEDALWWVWRRAKDAKDILDSITPGGGGGIFGTGIGPSVGPDIVPSTNPGDYYPFDLGGKVPRMLVRHMGGSVPGRKGQRVPVLAEAGETWFGGAPTLANARPGGINGGSGGGAHELHIHLHDSVVTDENSMNRLAEKIFSVQSSQLSRTRRMTNHRV